MTSLEPVIHSVAGKLYAGPGILLGADSPPVIFLASFFNIIFVVLWQIYRPEKHQTRTSILSYNIPGPLSMLLEACGLPLRGPRLRPDPGILRLGACSLAPLIMIRGPNLVQSLDMILSSAAMVCSWPGLA